MPNEQRCKSEFGRQVTVDLKADADLNECWRIPSHALLLMLATNKLLHWAAAQKGALEENFHGHAFMDGKEKPLVNQDEGRAEVCRE